MPPQESDLPTLSRSELLAIFDSDPARAEEKYIALYRNLVRYFEWNHRLEPEDMAQEALKRGFARLQEGQTITAEKPASYFFGIARNLVREGWKAQRHEQVEQPELPMVPSLFHNLNPSEQRIFLRECVSSLPAEELQLLVAYVEGKGEDWAQKAGLQPAAVRTRIHRIRKRLEELASTRTGGKASKKS